MRQRLRINISNTYTLLVGIYIATVWVFNYDAELNYISQLAFIIMMLGGMFYCLRRGYLRIDKVYLKFGALAVLALVSVLWAVDPSHAKGKAITVCQLVLLAFCTYIIVDTREKLEFLLKLIVGAGYFMYAYTLYSYGVDGLQELVSDELRVGEQVNQENAFGFYSALVFLVVLYQALYSKKRKYLVLVPIPVIMTVISGSKRAMLLLVVEFFVVVFLQARKKRVRRMLLAVFVATVVVWILYNTGIMDVFLRRVLLMQSGTDESTIRRMQFIEFGLEKIKESPVWGYGVEQFEVLYGREKGIAVASHINYIQIMVSFGVIGAVLWYSMYLDFIKTGIKYVYEDNIAKLLLLISVLSLINDITTTTLINKTTYVLLAMCYSGVRIIRRRDTMKDE